MLPDPDRFGLDVLAGGCGQVVTPSAKTRSRTGARTS